MLERLLCGYRLVPHKMKARFVKVNKDCSKVMLHERHVMDIRKEGKRYRVRWVEKGTCPKPDSLCFFYPYKDWRTVRNAVHIFVAQHYGESEIPLLTAKAVQGAKDGWYCRDGRYNLRVVIANAEKEGITEAERKYLVLRYDGENFDSLVSEEVGRETIRQWIPRGGIPSHRKLMADVGDKVFPDGWSTFSGQLYSRFTGVKTKADK